MYATLCKTTSDVDIMHDIGIAFGVGLSLHRVWRTFQTQENSPLQRQYTRVLTLPHIIYIYVYYVCIACTVMKSNHIEATCSNLHFQRGRGEVRIPSPGPSAAFAARAGRLPRCVRATMGKAAAASAAAAERYCWDRWDHWDRWGPAPGTLSEGPKS